MKWKDEKDWYKSKTLWVGALQIISGIALGVSDALGAGMVLTLSGFATIVLRTITKSKLRFD